MNRVRISFFVLTLVFVFAGICGCSKEGDTIYDREREESNNPTPDPDDDNNTEEPDETPDMPDTPIGPYDGERADDAASDAAGTNEDIYWEANTFNKMVTLHYSETGVKIENSDSKIKTYTNGAHAVVDFGTNSVKNVEIVVTGVSSDGSLKVYGANKFKLTLGGVELTSKRGPAINIQCGKRCFVHMPEGSVNRFVDATAYSDDFYYPSGVSAADEDRKACFFSEGDLIFSGTGVMVVAGNQKHAVATDDSFTIRPGATLVVTSAAKNAIHVKGDSDGNGVTVLGGLIHATVASQAGKCIKTDANVTVQGGRLLLKTSGNAYYDTAEKDTSSASGIKADMNITISGGLVQAESTGTGGKGLSADGAITVNGGTIKVSTSGGQYRYSNSVTSSPKGIKAEGNIDINGGRVDIEVTGASEGSEGLESKSVLTVNGGETSIYAYDDAVNAAVGININSGRLYAYAVNNDGIDSNGYMNLCGGLVISSGAARPEEAFDCDRSSDLKVTGGTMIGVAGAAISPSTSATTQRTVIYNGISISAGQLLAIVDSSSTPILLFTVPRTLNGGTTLFFSSDKIAAGATYTVYSNVSLTSSSEPWHGWYESGSWSGGTKVGTFTSSSMITSVGGSTGPGGGGPGGRW